MYECKHFDIQELVPEHVFAARSNKAWELLDDRALQMLDAIRDRFGPTTVNNAYKGGDRNWSGLRTFGSPYFSQYSQHSFGRAFDCLFRDHTAEEAREYIMGHKDEFPYINAIELGVSWLHFDVRNTDPIKAFRA